MPLKTSSVGGLQRSARLRHHQSSFLLFEKRSRSHTSAHLAAKKAKKERRKAELLLQSKQQKTSQLAAGDAPRETSPDILSCTLARCFSEDDRSAADILATLYHSGVFGQSFSRSSSTAPHGSGRDPSVSSCTALEIPCDSISVSDISLPSMQQTNIMLQSWRSESKEIGTGTYATHGSNNSDIDDMEPVHTGMGPSYPLTPELSSGPSSARSSFSAEPRPFSTASTPTSPSGMPSIYSDSKSTNYMAYSQHGPCDQSYFSPLHYRAAAPSQAMPSPPQSPGDSVHFNNYCFGVKNTPSSPPTYALPTMQQQLQQHQQHQQQQQVISMPKSIDRITTTVVTLPPPVMASVEPATPVSSLLLSAAFGRNASVKATTPKKEKIKMPGKRTDPLPKPHCNVKYETAELDFIMYQRCTKNRAWDDVTGSFNAALPRLRQYAEMDYMRLGIAGDKAAVDRYRPRPERTTPGLQASYYRQRLALPLLDEDGRLVFDEQTNKQVFTEVMVRDDKSRKMRRLNRLNGTGGKAAGSDDARVHLVLYFPERVSHYDYWFVTAEDKALARQRTYERNLQRAQRGLPAWVPGNDDPETGILLRTKDA